MIRVSIVFVIKLRDVAKLFCKSITVGEPVVEMDGSKPNKMCLAMRRCHHLTARRVTIEFVSLNAVF